MEKDSKFVGNEQDVKAQMRRQIRTFCYHPERASFEIARQARKGMSHAGTRSFVENWMNSDEENFGSGCGLTNGPETKAEHIRFWFPELSEEEALEEAKRDDKFRRTLKKNMGKWNSLLAISKGVQMADRLVKKQPSMDQEEAPEGIETASDRAFHYAMHYFMKTKPSRITRSAYRREPGRVSSRSRRTLRAAASVSSSSSGDSGGSEPPQSDPDLPSFRFVRSGTLRSYLKTDRFLSSWRPVRPVLMAHVRRWAA